ncbi:MAG: GDSL family lipase, partial [Pseudomonadota bacterium]
MRRSVGKVLVTGGLVAGSLLAAHGQNLSSSTPASPTSARRPSSPEADTRWRDSFDAFAAADRAQAPQMGGVLFVGSSSIRLWNNLEQSFETQPVIIKRGFGGSRLADCVQHLNHLVIPYQPRLVVVYAGDNDLAEGATPE